MPAGTPQPLPAVADVLPVPHLLVRLCGERFALDLRAAEEVIEMPALAPVPEARRGLLGVFPLRGEFVPVYAPELVLGLAAVSERGVALVVRVGPLRAAFALDDVDDVIPVDPAALLRPPATDAAERIVLGITRRAATLVSVIDAAALVAACTGARPAGGPST